MILADNASVPAANAAAAASRLVADIRIGVDCLRRFFRLSGNTSSKCWVPAVLPLPLVVMNAVSCVVVVGIVVDIGEDGDDVIVVVGVVVGDNCCCTVFEIIELFELL